MLFNFKTNITPGLASAQPNAEQTPYNRFFNHSERQKARLGPRKKNVRFSNDTSSRRERDQSEMIELVNSKPILKK